MPYDATLTPNQLNLFHQTSDLTATSPVKRKPIKRNPYNGTWLKAYVDALINNRAVHLTRR